ncbi:hypothetical protein DAEQUDRAFT_733055 [Daedalea quercina L-15889]|uniref:Uncharacterized protein n=1 Tax=Daedalea quercina L-15889 TaxID=1314783 RepID=A0A165L8X9_9APHY|nr:hypothetical protein DAEQUDRAFT_733055 [Daedalea quercina L-15889]
MRPTTPLRRALNAETLGASLRSSSSTSTSAGAVSSRRQLATISADMPGETPELQIFDIFDAPARLGTSPMRLRIPPRSPSSPSMSQPRNQPIRLMVPTPVIFDGPSGTPPRSPPSSSVSPVSASAPAAFFDPLPHSLPPPETFDGPAHTRGPRREVRPTATTQKKTSWLTPSFLMPLLGVSGAGLFGLNKKAELK